MKHTVNMEQHPVPQNITGFQFRLIGDMTVRQFLYLAGGILFAYIFLQLGLPSLIKWFLAASFAGAGFAFAFVPIEERPLDRWLVSFFKSIYSPTQFLWKKRPVSPEILTLPVPVSLPEVPEILKKEETAAKIEEYLMTLPTAPVEELDQKEANLLSQILSEFPSQPQPTQPTQPIIPSVAEPEPPATPTQGVPPGEIKSKPPEENLEKRTKELTEKISVLEQELQAKEMTRKRFLEIQGQLSQLLREKENLIKELVELKKTLAKEQEIPVKPIGFAQAPKEETVKIVPPSVGPKIGMPKPPDIPNAPSGIVKTQKGAILPGIIVEIRSQEGTPVRALKTGKLGQFAVSTPLPNGIYTIHLEDPQKNFYFDTIEVTTRGEIMAPFEISAKTQRDREKEEIKKKLFSQDNF